MGHLCYWVVTITIHNTDLWFQYVTFSIESRNVWLRVAEVKIWYRSLSCWITVGWWWLEVAVCSVVSLKATLIRFMIYLFIYLATKDQSSALHSKCLSPASVEIYSYTNCEPKTSHLQIRMTRDTTWTKTIWFWACHMPLGDSNIDTGLKASVNKPVNNEIMKYFCNMCGF